MNLSSSILNKIKNPGKVPPLKRIAAKYIKLTVSEIRQTCESNPNHPLAQRYYDSTENIGLSGSLVVFQQDMNAILEDRELVIEEIDEYPYRTTKRRLGDPLNSPGNDAPKVTNETAVDDGGDDDTDECGCG